MTEPMHPAQPNASVAGESRDRAKKPYLKPAFRHEKVFETMALACGKVKALRARAATTARIPSHRGLMQALFDPRDLSKNELAAQALRSFGELRLCVTGSSMLPAVRPDDELLIRCCRIDEAGPDDIVLFIRQRRLFAHRVVARSAAHLVTQGDGLAEPDLPVARA